MEELFIYSSDENCLLSQTVGPLGGLVRKSRGKLFNSGTFRGFELGGPGFELGQPVHFLIMNLILGWLILMILGLASGLLVCSTNCSRFLSRAPSTLTSGCDLAGAWCTANKI